MVPRRDNRWLIGLVLLLLLAAGLRFYRLDAQSFWNDEGNSARLSERSIDLIIEGTASDIHPPFYYLLLHGWRRLVGDSEFGLRLLSAFLGVGLVALTAALAGRARAGNEVSSRGSPRVVLLVALNPALVYYSQETRMYQLLAFLAVLAMVLLLVWLERPAASPARRASLWLPAAYVLVLTAGLYTHYFFPAVLAVHGLLVLFLAGRHLRRLLAWLGMVGAALLLYSPWLPIFVRQAGGRPAVREPVPVFMASSGRWLAFGDTLTEDAAGWLFVALFFLVIGGLLLRPASHGRYRLVGLAGLVVPVFLMWLLGTTRPPFYKFMLMAAPPLAMLAGRGWWAAGQGWGTSGQKRPVTAGGRLLAMVLVVLIIWGAARSLNNMYHDPAYARADYRAMAARISAEDHPNAGIILNAANQWEVFTYYHQDGAPVYPLPRGYPDPAQIDAELAEIAGRHDRLYLILWGEAERDPERLVERWLDAHAFKARDEWLGDVRFITYAVPDEPAAAMARPTDYVFGDPAGRPAIELLGYALRSATVAPGDIIQLTLFWQTAEPLDTRYKVFLHLVDDSGQIVAQRDSEPGGGLSLTTTWPPGETIVDNHGILVPVDLSPGRFTLLLGLYDLIDPAVRLPATTDGTVIDAIPLETIQVTGD
jgi:mannosyltransferase